MSNDFLHLLISSCKIVHLGVALSEVEDGSQRIILYYTDPGTTSGTQEAASFKMGDLTGRWARFTLTVQGAEVGVLGSSGFQHQEIMIMYLDPQIFSSF